MEDRKSKTLFVRNLPFTTNNDALEKVFSEIGPLKQCFVVKNKDDDKCKGYGYVTYSLLEDAEKAKKQIEYLDSRKLFINYANKKKDTKIKKSLSHKVMQDNTKTGEHDVTQDSIKTEEKIAGKSHDVKKEEISYLKAKSLLVTGFTEEDKVQTTLDKLSIKNISKTEFPVKGRDQLTVFMRFKSIRDLKKGQKILESKGLHAVQLSKENKIIPQKLLKQARLIIRNLSFQCTQSHLHEIFSKYGEVSEVKIPKKPDGKLCGFGFVQFLLVSSAERALKEMNSRMIRGRTVAVDWAVPKRKFEKNNQTYKDGSSEEEDESEDEESDNEKSEESDDELSDDSSSSTDSEHSSDEDNDKSLDDSTDEGFDESSDIKSKQKKEMPVDNKVEDGRTLFIRNLSYETEEDTLSDVMSEFGHVNYCRIVVDPKTEHSKGSGFVQFRNVQAADACLHKSDDEGPGIIVDGRKLFITKAVSRQKATELKKKEEKTKEDKRNVHLVREGLIRQGTKDAEGLTKEDLIKRNKIEDVKRQRLKNPNIFVSTTRLCVHNLPTSMDEKELKKIFLTAAGNKARITECRIMRDKDRVNTKGIAKSRGYAFINFTDHHHAIQGLKNTNNNLSLFNDGRRLIVEFSLENKNALLAKEKRLERFQTRQKQLKQEFVGGTNKRDDKDIKKNKQMNKDKQKDKITERYIGNVKLPAGQSNKNVMPSHWGPKIRHKPRPQKGPQQSGRKQSGPIPEKRKKQFDQTPVKQKRRKKSETVDSFDNLVNSYKKKIMSSKSTSKWFDN